MEDPIPKFYAGVDTHKDQHALCVLDSHANIVLESLFEAKASGYKAMSDALDRLGRIEIVAIEGTASYGAGLTQHLQKKGFCVKEALRPGKKPYCPDGKTDRLDAYFIAKLALFKEYGGDPKDTQGCSGELAVLLACRKSAVRESVALTNCALGLIVKAPESLRERFRGCKSKEIMEHLKRIRPSKDIPSALSASLRSLARRWSVATEEIERLTEDMSCILNENYAHLLSCPGVGVVAAAILVASAGDNPERFKSEAAFAKSAGVCPIPASSGKTARHRLNRQGDRQANYAIHMIATVRMRFDAKTKSYIAKRQSEGKTKKEAMRCLKRYICREIYRAILKDRNEPKGLLPLRKTRESLEITLEKAASDLKFDANKISRIERLKDRNIEFEKLYWRYLNSLKE